MPLWKLGQLGCPGLIEQEWDMLGPLISTMLGYQNHHPSWLYQVHQLDTHLAMILWIQRSS
jgi:hypothetical protein